MSNINILFATHAWEDYLYWQQSDKKILKRINLLVKEITREPFSGIGKPELLKWNLEKYWSRRIDQEHRLVYKINPPHLHILSCRYHYHK